MSLPKKKIDKFVIPFEYKGLPFISNSKHACYPEMKRYTLPEQSKLVNYPL